jgi:Bacterial regulatory protein, Fis family
MRIPGNGRALPSKGNSETEAKVDQTLTLLVEDEPQRQARKLLDHVATRCRARAAAVVTVSSDDLASFVGEMPLSQLGALQTLWRVEAKDLRAGRPVNGGDYNVMPLMDGRELVGLLFMDGGTRVENRNPAVQALAAALKVARERPLRRIVEPETAAGAEIERRRLVAALERHEWNIARVARLIGVTRRTIYLRLKRYNIDRQRVPKTLKPCPPLESA